MKVKHLSKKIHRNYILEDINFHVEPGSITGVVGRNGAGKTTLLRTMAGILIPSRGDVSIDGRSIFQHPEMKAATAFVPDSSEALKNFSTDEIKRLYQSLYPRFDPSYFDRLMDRFGLEKRKKIGHYSKGMKALFGLITAFSTNASYILLDEPTDGLDVIVKKQVMQLLIEEASESNVSIILSSHRLDELEMMANDIILLRHGRVESHYELDKLKERYKKLQVVFEETMPAALEASVHILDQTGRVYTILVPESDPAVIEQIHNSGPLLYEELAMTLEDYFVARLGGDTYDA
ncbi:ABC transporter ATP-binding protein [Alkalicoccus chagannorensis]|uniref:ABC transporter ATP-binding protein n=1 Tax=Alkalicoccus chagannorensis TaxID=427072 RepID=UPI00041F73A4|nr:ABC transporter ATP-binding protein [Alkalicoccus chagannorensis]